MSGFSNAPRLVRAGIVTMDPDTTAVRGVIAPRCSPDWLIRWDATRRRGPEPELDVTAASQHALGGGR